MSLPNGNKNNKRTIGGRVSKTFPATAAVWVVIALLSFLLLANAMNKGIGHDEQMYCTAGYFTAQGKLIYRDFSYVAQMPYHPLLLGLLYKITGTHYYLLTARLLSVACEVGILVCIVGICRSILRNFPLWSAGFSMAAVVLYCTNSFVLYASGYAWNHSAVILCVLAALWLYQSWDKTKPAFWRLFSIGALLSFATFMRPTTALVFVVFAVALIYYAFIRLKNRKTTALPFVLGAFVSALWPVIVLIKAPDAFFLNVVKIPALNAAFLRQAGWVYDKTQLTLSVLTSSSYILLVLMAAYFYLAGFLQTQKALRTDKPKISFFISLVIAFIVIAFIPPTMWLQYWASPVAFIIIALAPPLNYLCSVTSEENREKRYQTGAAVLLFLAVGLSLYAKLPATVSWVTGIFEPGEWEPVRVHKIAEDICQSTTVQGSVLTLAPLYAIEGGCDIYTEFSSGPFVYRITDRLSENEKKIVHAAGPGDLKKLIRREQLSAIIVGTEPERLEKPLISIPTTSDWQRKVYGQKGPVVYFYRPEKQMQRMW